MRLSGPTHPNRVRAIHSNWVSGHKKCHFWASENRKPHHLWHHRVCFAPSWTCTKIASERCTGIGLWTSETTLPEQTGLPKFGATQWGSHTISPQRFWKNGYLRGPSRPSAAQKGWLPTRPGAPRFLPQKNRAFLRTEMILFPLFFFNKTRIILQKKETKTRFVNRTPQYRVGVFNFERFCLIFLQNYASFCEKK